MNDPDFDALVTRIRNATGFGKEFAIDYAKLIGDEAEVENGLVLVRNEDERIIARLPGSVLGN